MTYKQEALAKMAEGIIKHLEKRRMEGYFFESSKECLEAILKEIPEGSSVTHGGSESIREIGLLDAIRSGNYHYLDRTQAVTPEEQREFYGEVVKADYYLMSSNAITLDGQLVNIDGLGNRVSSLIFGPQNVIVVVGMNKVAKDVETAIERVHNLASPPNAIRLNKNTPCAKTGVCGDCLSPDCICCQTVVTRYSRIPNRIKVYLVAEELGF